MTSIPASDAKREVDETAPLLFSRFTLLLEEFESIPHPITDIEIKRYAIFCKIVFINYFLIFITKIIKSLYKK